jgi:hypothetical protein
MTTVRNVLVLLGIAIQGCATETPAPAAETRPADGSYSAGDFARQLGEARCAKQHACREQFGSPWTSYDACIRRLDDADFLQKMASGLPAAEALSMRFSPVPRADVESCFERLLAAPCSARISAMCSELFSVRGGASEPQPCSMVMQPHLRCPGLNENCIQPPGRSRVCAMCEAPGPPGARCTLAIECASSFCGDSGQCEVSELRSLGIACVRNDQCREGLWCKTFEGSKACAPRMALNEPADFEAIGERPDWNCSRDLVPRRNSIGEPVCAQYLPDGAPCGFNEIECAGLCAPTQSGSATGHCAHPDLPPVQGERCLLGILGLYCDPRSSTPLLEPAGADINCTCIEPPQLGEVCTQSSTTCRAGNCRTEPTVGVATCGPKQGDGIDCLSDLDCASGYCQEIAPGMVRRCTARPQCGP